MKRITDCGVIHYHQMRFAWAINKGDQDTVTITPLDPCTDEDLIHAAIDIESRLEVQRGKCYYARYNTKVHSLV